MALVGKQIFIQRVDAVRRLGLGRLAEHAALDLDNPCVAQLMCAPDRPRSDDLCWINDPGSVMHGLHGKRRPDRT